jgi:hypothetical protein
MPSPTFRDLYSEDQANKLEGALKDALRPLTDALRIEEERIPKLQAELATARLRRTALVASIRSIDKTAVPTVNKGNARRKGLTSTEAHRQFLESLTEWLQARKEELNGNGGFRAVELEKLAGSPFTSGRASARLNELHSLGIVQLVRHVKGPSAGGHVSGKFYKVI